MPQRPLLIAAVAVLLVAAGLLYWTFAPGPTPGADRTAELVRPSTGERVKISWATVLKAKEGQYDPFTARYRYPFPGTKEWAYVVEAGEEIDLAKLNKMAENARK